jgi:apolipoprotein N-acyltransferase
VAATSGISALVDASGTVVERMDVGEDGWFVRSVPLRGAMSPAGVVGGWVELLIALVAVGAVGWGAWRRGRAARIA